MSKIRRLGNIALILLLASVALGDEPRGVIMGGVFDGISGSGIPEADIFIVVESGGCPSLHSTTDANGRFLITGFEIGSYRVRASKVGYVTREWSTSGGADIGDHVVLTPAKISQSISLTLPRSTQISGTVYDEEGNPLSSGYVFFESPLRTNTSYHVITDDRGTYWIADIPPGVYYISARRFSQERNQVIGDLWYYPGVLTREEAELLELGEAGAVADIRFGAPREAGWTFRVTSDTGKPLAQAEVSLFQWKGGKFHPLSNPNSLSTIRTGSDGIGEVRTLEPGEYYAYLSKVPPPFAPWFDPSADLDSPERYAKSFVVKEGQKSGETTFVVRPGHVVRAKFQPAPGTEVLIGSNLTVDDLYSEGTQRQSGLYFVVPVHASREGFTAEGLLPGERYRVRFFYNNENPKACPTRLLQGDRLLAGDDLVGAAEGKAEPIYIEILPCATISGTTSRSGWLSAERVGGEPISEKLYTGINSTPMTQAVENRFTFRGLAPGIYKVRAVNGPEVGTVAVKAGETREVRW